MAKNENTEKRENKPQSVDFNETACKYRHESINKRVDNLESRVNEKIQGLKEKIRVETKRFGERIDRFDEKVRGNGDIGLEEELRKLKTELEMTKEDRKEDKENIDAIIGFRKSISKWKKRIIYFILALMVITFLVIGGSYKGFRLPPDLTIDVEKISSPNPEKEEIKKVGKEQEKIEDKVESSSIED